MRAEHPAPGLRTALEQLPRPGGSVLDLGPALEVNVAYFQAAGSRVRIADLDRSIGEANAENESGAAWDRRLEELLPFHEGESFDLVLAWDLPNYLGRDRWPAVARRIIERVTLRGSFHLFSRVAAEMPARPCRYRIGLPGTVSEEIVGGAVAPAPRLPHAEIEKLHAGLVALHSHLGKHGVQEYVLQPAAAHHVPPRPVARPRQRAR